MIDDHDECEWVNISSGTGSPVLSESCKTVVCVCMCSCVRACVRACVSVCLCVCVSPKFLVMSVL